MQMLCIGNIVFGLFINICISVCEIIHFCLDVTVLQSLANSKALGHPKVGGRK